jgi:hypothetical protein
MQHKINFKVWSQEGNPEAYAECEAFIFKMQKIMRLQDWDIRLEFLSGEEVTDRMGDSNCLAICSRVTGRNMATIRVNCEHPEINDELEMTLIHEMCHIIDGFYNDVTQDALKDESICPVLNTMYETQTDNFARAIWNALNYTEVAE